MQHAHMAGFVPHFIPSQPHLAPHACLALARQDSRISANCAFAYCFFPDTRVFHCDHLFLEGGCTGTFSRLLVCVCVYGKQHQQLVLGVMKRCPFGEFAGEQENCHKRLSGEFHSCSSVSDYDSLAFLKGVGLLELAQQSGPQLGFWQCTAELNVLLRAFQHTFQDLQLLELHCYTRSRKALAFDKVVCAHGMRSVQELPANPHLSTVRLVLEALADCEEVCITQLSFVAPPWLEPWCRKWGLPSRHIRLSVVQGYHGQPQPLRASAVYNIGQAPMTTTAPQQTVYIPLVQ